MPRIAPAGKELRADIKYPRPDARTVASRESRIRRNLTAWYRRARRDLPWRRTDDPYAILVAEFLLQRTRVASGTAYYERFLARFPTVQDLAAASEADVLRVWEGLGFYRRARNLHAAARAIVRDHGGRVPASFERLKSLPGIGPYTAGAVASIAFSERVPAVDGNAVRVISRLERIGGPESTLRGRVSEVVRHLLPSRSPGSFNQALMELGATVCTPGSPRCPACPVRADCGARRHGEVDRYPPRGRRRPTPTVPVAFALVEDAGRVLLMRRPESAILGGFWALPGGEVPSPESGRDRLRELLRDALGIAVKVGPEVETVRRTFSHKRWTGSVYRCELRERPGRLPSDARWATPGDIRALPLAPVHRDVLSRMTPGSSLRTA